MLRAHTELEHLFGAFKETPPRRWEKGPFRVGNLKPFPEAAAGSRRTEKAVWVEGKLEKECGSRKAKAAKLNKWGHIKLESFCATKVISSRTKRQLQCGRTYSEVIYPRRVSIQNT